MDAYKIKVKLDQETNVSRTLIVPKDMSFQKLHEIICILFNIDENEKYKFLFEDIGLTIRNTGTLNRDNIDSRFELIDDYFKRYSEIKYINSIWNIIINVTHTVNNESYPQVLELECKYNPSASMMSVEEYSNALKKVDNKVEPQLIETNLSTIQKSLLELFQIPYVVEKNNIKVLKKEETLEKYI